MLTLWNDRNWFLILWLLSYFLDLIFSCNNPFKDNKAAANKVLPDEIVEEILSRLPVKSLLQFRCICKAWCALISSNPHFVDMHLNRSIQNTNLLLLNLKGHSDDKIYVLDYEACDRPVQIKHPLDNSSNFGIQSLSCCNGLVCIHKWRGDICLWNPSTKKQKEIPKPIIILESKSYVRLGFTFNPISKDYEIVRVVGFENSTRHSEVEVYSLRKNTWTRIKSIPYRMIPFNNESVFFDGALHWLGTHCTEEPTNGFGEIIIFAFEIGSREIREVMHLPKFDRVGLRFDNLSAVDGYLCLLCNCYTHLELWMMKEYSDSESWIKYFISKPCAHYVGVTKKGEVIFQSPRWLCLYDPKDQSLRDLKIRGREFSKAMNFVESLVPF